MEDVSSLLVDATQRDAMLLATQAIRHRIARCANLPFGGFGL
jgi:hypothetical protein